MGRDASRRLRSWCSVHHPNVIRGIRERLTIRAIVVCGAQWMNTSFMQLTTVVQAFENAALCVGDGEESWGMIDESATGEE